MSSEYYYDNARRRYYEACSEINHCQNRIAELQRERKKVINQINQLNADIKSNQKALNDVTKIITQEGDLRDKHSSITKTLSRAAENFNGMVHASEITTKNLDKVFSDEMRATKNTLEAVITSLKDNKKKIHNRLEELKNQLKKAQSNLENIEHEIKSTSEHLRDWQNVKRNAAIDMEYYRRKMREED